MRDKLNELTKRNKFVVREHQKLNADMTKLQNHIDSLEYMTCPVKHHASLYSLFNSKKGGKAKTPKYFDLSQVDDNEVTFDSSGSGSGQEESSGSGDSSGSDEELSTVTEVSTKVVTGDGPDGQHWKKTITKTKKKTRKFRSEVEHEDVEPADLEEATTSKDEDSPDAEDEKEDPTTKKAGFIFEGFFGGDFWQRHPTPRLCH